MARKPRSEAEKRADTALGKRLARLRKERGYTQVELAEKTGVVQVIISDYERGKLRPHPDMIVRLAKAMQISADELLGLSAPQANTPPVNRRFLRRLQAVDKLPKRDQEALLRTIDAFLAARKAS
jgi:transcriptional regulator with XRE-family HTH domain